MSNNSAQERHQVSIDEHSSFLADVEPREGWDLVAENGGLTADGVHQINEDSPSDRPSSSADAR